MKDTDTLGPSSLVFHMCSTFVTVWLRSALPSPHSPPCPTQSKGNVSGFWVLDKTNVAELVTASCRSLCAHPPVQTVTHAYTQKSDGFSSCLGVAIPLLYSGRHCIYFSSFPRVCARVYHLVQRVRLFRLPFPLSSRRCPVCASVCCCVLHV